MKMKKKKYKSRRISEGQALPAKLGNKKRVVDVSFGGFIYSFDSLPIGQTLLKEKYSRGNF